MPNQKIFCNSPWYDLHIYWDGGLGFCCYACHRVYSAAEESQYNIKNMSIREWYDSKPMRQSRLMMFGNQPNSMCQNCYAEEKVSGISHRSNLNLKSVIFVNENFVDSYQQSPGRQKFEFSRLNSGAFDGLPVALHIDLGNFCNLACKMCSASASSKIAVQEVKWGIQESKKYVGTDWTQDQLVWERFLREVAAIPNLKNIHFMGGETLLTRRFDEFVNYMIEQGRFDINFSFVTNGTVFNEPLMEKLSKFNRVGIEVSLETLTPHNSYQRQGTDNELVLKNIQRYLQYRNHTSVSFTVRPAISLLTIGYYDTLLRYCFDNNIIVNSLMVTNPKYLDVVNLPNEVKQQYKEKFLKLEHDLNLTQYNHRRSFNRNVVENVALMIKKDVAQCLNLLSMPSPTDADAQLKRMVDHCRRWDQVYKYNALDLYPELAEVFVRHGY